MDRTAARLTAPLAPALEPGTGGPDRSSMFGPLWGRPDRGQFLLLLRVLAAIGATLALGGLLARRMSTPWLPR